MSRVPRIRFKGFEEDWEQRKLGEVGKACSGIGFPDSEQGGTIGTPFFKVSDMNIDGNENEMTAANNYVTTAQIVAHKWSPIEELPAIFFAKVGAAVMLNRKRLCRFPFLLDNNTMAYSLDKTKWDADFAKALFETVDLTSLVQIGALPSYNSGDIEAMEILLPSLSEQSQIGAFFKKIDHLITLHQSKYFRHILNAITSCTLYWEQRKVGSICLISTGKSNTQDRVEDGKYPFYVRSSIVERSNRYLFDEEAVLTVGDGVGTGKVFHYVNGKYDLHQRVYRMFGFEKDISAKYFFYYFSNNFYDRVMAMTAKTSVDSVRHEMIADMDIIVPYITEQKFITDIFQNFDRLITLHQRKLEKLKIIKKSMLENLFPQNGEKTPKIRFSGFTEDWEQRKLGEIAERIIRKNEKLESTLPLTISAQYGLIDQNEFFDKRIASKDVRSYYLIKKGEFAYNKSTSVDAPLGAIKRLDKYKNGVLSTLYILFKIIDDTSTSSDYLVTYYATDLWHRGIQSIAAEGARNHGLLNIAPNDFFETILSIPLNVSEQKKVGDFFMSLDRLITLHQSKLEKLQKIKKSMLESMFV